eukprot:12406860-Karenia_brevis.AAC.1
MFQKCWSVSLPVAPSQVNQGGGKGFHASTPYSAGLAELVNLKTLQNAFDVQAHSPWPKSGKARGQGKHVSRDVTL